VILKVAILILVSYFLACRRSREEAERDGDEEVHGLRRAVRQRHSGQTFDDYFEEHPATNLVNTLRS